MAKLMVWDRVREADSKSLRMVCAVIDSQGFTIGNQFFPRIVAVTNGVSTTEYEFNPQLPPLDSRALKTVMYQQNKLHGYSMSTNCCEQQDNIDYFNQGDFECVLKTIYITLASQQKPYFGISNTKLCKYLISQHIPFVNLSAGPFSAPSHSRLTLRYNSDSICTKHVIPERVNRKFTCCRRKVDNTWRWLQETCHLTLLLDKLHRDDNGESPKTIAEV